jgi:hypothetical protein
MHARDDLLLVIGHFSRGVGIDEISTSFYYFEIPFHYVMDLLTKLFMF